MTKKSNGEVRIINGYIKKQFNINMELSENELRDLLLEINDILERDSSDNSYYTELQNLYKSLNEWLEINRENSLL